MKRKRTILSSMCVIFVVLALLSTVQDAGAAAPKKFKWKFINPGPLAAPFSPFNVQLCEKVRERSNGRLDIKIFMFGELPYKAADVLTVVQDRKVEMGSNFDGHCEGVQDWYGLLAMPTIFTGRVEALKMNDEVLMPFMNKTLRKNLGVIPLARCVWNANDIFSGKKLTSVADVKGLKVRCPSAIQEKLISDLGGVPFYVDQPETYTALQKGTVDAAMTGNMFARASKWFEVTKWLFIWDLTQAAEGIYVNQAAVNELPKDLRDILLTTTKEINDLKLKKAVEFDTAAIEEAKKVYNCTVTYISAKDKAETQKVGDMIIDNWLKGPKRSADAKKLYELVMKAKK